MPTITGGRSTICILRRQLITIGEDVVNDAYAYDLEREAQAQIETAEKKLFDLATLGEYDSGFQPFNHALKDAIDVAEAAFQKSGKTIGVAHRLRRPRQESRRTPSLRPCRARGPSLDGQDRARH